MVSIASTLGVGSGIDTTQLITDLTTTAKSGKDAQITAAETANKAKVSALADAANGIDTFATALTTLVAGGTLTTQPTSSDSAVAVSAIAGSRLAGLTATISVQALAKAQSLVSAAVATTTALGAGSFTITNAAGKAFTVTVPANDSTLAGVARAISASGAGVTASVVTSGSTGQLVMKGATGTASAFTVQASGAFAGFNYSGVADSGDAMTANQTASDAQVTIDGVATTRPTNSISDLITGVKVELKQVTSGVTIGSSSPTTAIRQAVLDFASAYNELKTTLDAATASGLDGGTAGALRNDTGVRSMQRMLGQLTSTVLNSGGSPATLAEIGVQTERDGTLSVDSTKLDTMLASNPDGVEAMFNPTQRSSSGLVQITSAMGATKPGTYQITDIVSGPPPSAMIDGKKAVSIAGILYGSGVTSASGLAFTVAAGVTSATITVDSGIGGALTTIRDQLRGLNGALTTSNNSATTEAADLVKQRAAMEADSDTYKAQLTAKFTAMDQRVASYKATQAYMTQQIALWTKSDD